MEFQAQVDARKYPPTEKHATIFKTFDELQTGQSMELINDHDPKPLYYQFSAERPNKFAWEYLQSGPDVWRVAIKKH